MRPGSFMRKKQLIFLLVASLVIAFSSHPQSAGKPPAQETILKADDVQNKLMPDRVFFRGQNAPVQGRNTAGVKYADGFFVLVGLVDSSGYSSGIREKYQAYLINEVPIEIGGQTLKPGAYGIGFVENNKFIVMDIGANDVLTTESSKDAEMKRPMPLQILPGSSAGAYKLYHLRDSVEFKRAK